MLIRARQQLDDPDINFIPLIDVLLVIVIFLAVSTTFTQERVLEVMLPQAQSQAEVPEAIAITIAADGRIAINEQVLPQISMQAISEALSKATREPEKATVVIRADANATHQSVVTVMQAAKQAGIKQLGLAAQVSD